MADLTEAEALDIIADGGELLRTLEGLLTTKKQRKAARRLHAKLVVGLEALTEAWPAIFGDGCDPAAVARSGGIDKPAAAEGEG